MVSTPSSVSYTHLDVYKRQPQAQLSYTHFGGDSFNAGTMHVDQAGVSSTAGGLGLEIGKTFGAGSIYTRVGVNHAFSGSVKTTYTSGSTVKLSLLHLYDCKGKMTSNIGQSIDDILHDSV